MYIKQTQRGATLIATLILLLLISALGLASAQSSIINTQITRNAAMTLETENIINNTLSQASTKLHQQPLGSSEYLKKTPTDSLYNPYNNEPWPSTHSQASTHEKSHYIIEYLGCVPHINATLENCSQAHNTFAIHLYKITAMLQLKNHRLYQHQLIKLTHPPQP